MAVVAVGAGAGPWRRARRVAQDPAGRVKTVKGTVYIEREGRRELALVGDGRAPGGHAS